MIAESDAHVQAEPVAGSDSVGHSAAVSGRDQDRMGRTASSDKLTAKGRSDGSLPRHGNRSWVRAVWLLRVIAELGGPGPLGELASGAGMSAPGAHRYLLGLARPRLVEQSLASGRYDFGSEIVELGVAALGRVDAVRFAS